MLQHLKHLVSESEGRYATDDELKFLEDFLKSTETRLSAYSKIRDNEEPLLNAVMTEALSAQKDAFVMNGQGRTIKARRDCRYVLRNIATAVLSSDVDRFRNGFLVWARTVMKSRGYARCSTVSRDAEYRVLKRNLNSEEFELAKAALALSQSFLQ